MLKKIYSKSVDFIMFNYLCKNVIFKVFDSVINYLN